MRRPTTRASTSTLSGFVALLMAGGLAAACSDDRPPEGARATTPSVTSSAPAPATTAPTPAPPPKRPRPVLRHPLVGLQKVPAREVVVAKIDNTRGARAQAGVNEADVVYVEQVEGGLTRLAAVFSTRLPRRVGPVRSARGSDIDLLAPYGRVGLVYSGANRGTMAALRRTRFVLSGSVGGAYRRLPSRPAPYNLFADVLRVASVRQLVDAHDVGFRWAPVEARLKAARPTPRVTVRMQRTRIGFDWDPRSRRWLYSRDGIRQRDFANRPVATRNVIVQVVRLRRSGFKDVAGNPTPFSVTTGAGPVIVFRDGRRLYGRWVRKTKGAATHYYDAHGRDLTLYPGGAWVLLAPQGSAISVAG